MSKADLDAAREYARKARVASTLEEHDHLRRLHDQAVWEHATEGRADYLIGLALLALVAALISAFVILGIA